MILKGKQVLLSSYFCYSRCTLIIVDVPINMQFKADFVIRLITFTGLDNSIRCHSLSIAPLFFLTNNFDNGIKSSAVEAS